MRRILLLEPNYKNKYPPIGLMKIATYHRMLGDQVVFFKGDVKDFILESVLEDCINKIVGIGFDKDIQLYRTKLKAFIKTRKRELLDYILENESNRPSLEEWLKYFANYYRLQNYRDNPKWDRIYVTTLFTFYWKITIETIEFAKHLVKDLDQLYVGGVMASLLSEEIEKETGIKPYKGILDKPGALDNNNIVIDDLPLDYSILDEIEYEYPTGSAYFTFMTKGCTRKCAFCSVPILEPTYKEKVETIDKFKEIKERYGEQQNLLLMDNNVLASPKFHEIIDEIKEMGFYKGATFIEPNQYEIAIKNLREGWNVRGSSLRAFKLLHQLLDRKKKNKVASQEIYNILEKYSLLKEETVSAQNILSSYPELSVLYEKHRDKVPKLRYVDFNQGTDARYVTDEFMKKMSEIPIRPLRIAFDYLGMQNKYIDAVRLAAKYGITELSNYLLYNFKDKPEELYQRMKINIDLAEELDVKIFSFPMKYIPLFGEDAKHRHYVGKNWCKKHIRAIQSILNVTKGIVASGRSFFEKAFGRDIDEFYEILYMPEAYIIYRKLFEDSGLTELWRKEYHALKGSNKWDEVKEIIESSDFSNISEQVTSDLMPFLSHYLIVREDVTNKDMELEALKRKYQKLVKSDRFVNLTLTYDFEGDD